MQTDCWLGEIRIFPFDSLPQGWVPCDGQRLTLDRDHMPLFSLLGNTFGGDGQHNFAVPDLRGKLPIGTDVDIDRGASRPLPNEAGAKENQPTIALVYAIAIDGMYPMTE